MTKALSRCVSATCYCLFLVVCIGSLHGKERTAVEWVQAMNKAHSSQSFIGKGSFWNGIDLTTIQFSQHIVDGKPQFKVRPLDGPQREITRTNETLSISLSPDDELREVSDRLSGNSLSRLLPPDVQQLSESYDITSLPDKRIADRYAVGVSIMPKVPDRYGFKIWIDKSSELLLRMEMCECDENQRLRNVVQFTELTILEGSTDSTSETNGEDDSDLSVNLVNEDQFASAGVQADWEPSFIPDGFVLSSTKTQDGALYNRTYSDGMNAFTVQTRPAPGDQKEDIQLETILGPTVIVLRSAADSRGRSQIVTVVGDLPRRTIWKIAEGVKFER